jgi:hypothetical protein
MLADLPPVDDPLSTALIVEYGSARPRRLSIPQPRSGSCWGRRWLVWRARSSSRVDRQQDAPSPRGRRARGRVIHGSRRGRRRVHPAARPAAPHLAAADRRSRPAGAIAAYRRLRALPRTWRRIAALLPVRSANSPCRRHRTNRVPEDVPNSQIQDDVSARSSSAPPSRRCDDRNPSTAIREE